MIVAGGLGQPGTPLVTGGLGLPATVPGGPGDMVANLAGSGSLSGSISFVNANMVANLFGVGSVEAAVFGDTELFVRRRYAKFPPTPPLRAKASSKIGVTRMSRRGGR